MKRAKWKPKALGKQVRTVDSLDVVPWELPPTWVTLHVEDFTSLCPVTGQRDFASLRVEYIAETGLIETKSFKLFIERFSNRPAFNERIVNEIADGVFAALENVSPTEDHSPPVRVTGRFARRGGISVEAVAERGSAARLSREVPMAVQR